MKKRRQNKGFTIVELVIVIAVIAILAAVLIPTFSGIVDKANKSSATQECTNVYKNYYAICKASSASVEEGLVFIDNGYAFTYMDLTLQELTYLGKLEAESEYQVDFIYVGSKKYDNVNIYDAVYSMSFFNGNSYEVYALNTSDGRYVFFYNEEFEREDLTKNRAKVYECPMGFSTNLDYTPIKDNDMAKDFLALNCFQTSFNSTYYNIELYSKENSNYNQKITLSKKDKSKITEYSFGKFEGQDYKSESGYEYKELNADSISIEASALKDFLTAKSNQDTIHCIDVE